MKRLRPALRKLEADLRGLELHWAMVGGMAVNVRSAPRTTHDLDVTVAVGSDREAESVIRDFQDRGYRVNWYLECDDKPRLMSVRLFLETEAIPRVDVDLMFASSGIEEEVVAAAETLAIMQGVAVPVATTAHLLALKTLAGRRKDITDFATLVQFAKEEDLLKAREALELITERGFHRGKDLQVEFVRLLELARQEI